MCMESFSDDFIKNANLKQCLFVENISKTPLFFNIIVNNISFYTFF